MTQDWLTFLSEMDLREKMKFTSYFPFYKIKQKELIMNSQMKPSLLYVVNGEVIAKNKMEQTIIKGGQMFNLEGFLLNQSIKENIYCLSSEANILIIEKRLLQQNFKIETFNDVMKIVLKQVEKKYKKDEEKSQNKDDKNVDIWTIFKKHPDR